MSEIQFKQNDPDPETIKNFPVHIGDIWIINLHFPIFNPIIDQYTVVRSYDDLLYGHRIILEDSNERLVSTSDPRETSVCSKSIHFDPNLRIWTIDYLD